MDKQTRKAPVIRFKGFNNDWEQVELNDIADKSTLKNRKNENKIVLTNSAELGIVKQQDYFDKDIANSKNLSNYYVVKNNYFVYNPRISNQAKYGPINYNSLGIVGIMSPLYFVFKVHNNVNNIFLGVLFKTSVWHRFMYENGDTGARADRFSIKDSVFMTMPLNIPSITEQSKIAKLFQSLDKTITLHEEKQRQLEQLKKALLQKMFADKSGYPAVRFAGFNDVWKQHKLGKIFSQKVVYINPKVENINLWSLTVKNGLTKKSDRYDRNFLVKKNDKFKLVKKNQIVYNPMNITLGALDINNVGDIAVSGYYIVMQSSSTFDSRFLLQLLKTNAALTKYKRYATGTLVEKQRVQFPTFSNITFRIPIKSEQEKIGRLFQKLDYTITLHAKKIEQLKRLKQALLQKMFV